MGSLAKAEGRVVIVHWTDEHDATILDLIRRGVTVADIARQMGRSQSSVYHRQWKLGQSKSVRPNVVVNDPVIVARVLKLYADNWRYRDIAADLQISKDNVSHIVAKHVTTKRSRLDVIGPRNYPPELVESVRRLFVDERVPMWKIGPMLKQPISAVRAIIDLHRILCRSRWTTRQVDELRGLLKAGKSEQEAATILERSLKSVAHKCDQLRMIANGTSRPISFPTLHDALKNRLKSSATTDKRRGRACDIDLPYLLALFEQQGGRCHYTGRPMSHVPNDPLAVSVDRVDSTRGHLKGNVVLCGVQVNVLKSDMTVRDFIETCGLVASYNMGAPAVSETAA